VVLGSISTKKNIIGQLNIDKNQNSVMRGFTSDVLDELMRSELAQENTLSVYGGHT
jgi:hypothetical protein